MANIKRAVLGIDGNAAFALLGEDLQVGEAEFVELAAGADERQQAAACKQALRNLRARLGMPDLSYELGPSHPMHV